MTEVPVPPVEPPQEHRLRFHEQLDEVVNDVVRLGALVCQTVPQGTDILLGGELNDAQRLIEDDDVIDRLSVSIEERCYSIMARQAPMAGELRRLITITKLVAELERSADLMVNVSKGARRIYGAPMSPKVRGVVAAMSKEAHRLLDLSVNAFVDADEALAAALDDMDDRLDQLNRDMVAAIFEGHASGELDLQSAVQLALVARYYERVGDHAVNIGERVTYMITGWLPEHSEE
jgi:phosphate transport system protein